MIVVLGIIIGMMGGIICFLYRAYAEKCAEFNRTKRNLLFLYDWMDLERDAGTCILAFRLQELGYHNILIYGWGYLGNRLYRELEHTSVKVTGILDRRYTKNHYQIPAYSLQSGLPKADAVILAVLYDTEKIRSEVGKVASCPIIRLEELIV